MVMRSATMRSAKNTCTAVNRQTISRASAATRSGATRMPRAAPTHSTPAQASTSGSATARLPPRPRSTSRIAPMPVPSVGGTRQM